MKHFIICLAVAMSTPAMAQTTLDVTLPGGSPVCSYTTGSVTNGSTPGHLQATATSVSPAGCGSGGDQSVTFGPASPLTPQTTTLGSNSGSVNFSFQALNATQCTASIAGTATGSFAGGSTLCTGTGSSTCSNRLVTAVASFTNTGTTSTSDIVTLNCNGVLSTATVTIPPPGGGGGGGSCTKKVPGTGIVTSFAQQGLATVRLGGGQTPTSVDMTSFASVFGTFPGLRGDEAIDILPVSNYISMQFTLPAGYNENASPGFWQKFSISTSYDDTRAAMTISTACGDFSNPVGDAGSTVVKNCWKNSLKSEGGVQVFTLGDPSTQCVLQDGVSYYLNIISADISGVTSSGGAAQSYRDGAGSKCAGLNSCSVPIQNGPNTQY